MEQITQFKDSEFMSARDKELVLKSWGRFLRALSEDDGGVEIDRHGNEMPKLFRVFTNRLYEHLHQNCSFIAHYNRFGFFTTYFENGEDTVQFLSQFDKRNAGSCGVPRSVECGSAWWVGGDYEDINNAMIEEAASLIPMIEAKMNAKQRTADIAEAQALLEKHGITASLK